MNSWMTRIWYNNIRKAKALLPLTRPTTMSAKPIIKNPPTNGNGTKPKDINMRWYPDTDTGCIHLTNFRGHERFTVFVSRADLDPPPDPAAKLNHARVAINRRLVKQKGNKNIGHPGGKVKIIKLAVTKT